MTSTESLKPLLATLSRAASARGLSDAEWARRAGIPRESLSRLRRRTDCDLSTLGRLANALGFEWQLVPRSPVPLTSDGLYPSTVSRDYEEQLLDLVRSGSTDPDRWRSMGPAWFMAGLAVLVAGSPSLPRSAALAVARQLQPGMTEPRIFQAWLDHSPLRPARFLPQLEH